MIARKNRWDHIFLRKCRTIEKLFAFHKQTIKGNIVLVKERTIEARLGDTRNLEIEYSFGKWNELPPYLAPLKKKLEQGLVYDRNY